MGQISESTCNLIAEACLQNNRLDHVSRVMGYHPSYLEQFIKIQNFILRGDGPLPFVYRHYIAIMKQEFLLQGGNPNWLMGMDNVPKKLRNIYGINKILAHKPWLLKTSHIEELTKGNENWSLAEVVHAIVILTHFHSLCSFVFSCGVNQELNQTDDNVTAVRERNDFTNDVSPTDSNQIDASQAVVGSVPQETPADIGCFVDDSIFVYQDFAKRSDPESTPIFRVQDYSWDDHGYSLVNRHDDYDYAEVNVLVERALKAFIKSVACYPERITKKEYDKVMREFKHSEKVHVNLMILESRMQAALMYALRTINEYVMTN
nr:unnamed protein product [Callosobruchus chinensis]